MVPIVWGMSLVSWQLFLLLSLQSHQPQTLLSVSSPLCPSSSRAQGKWLHMKFFALALYEALCISSHLSLADRNRTAFHNCMLFRFFSQVWRCRLGRPAWGLDPTCSGGMLWLLKYLFHTSAATHGSPACPCASPPHSLLVML